MIRHSRQRDAIQNFLMTRCDHPTAETIYENIREEFPNVSLGTVYRNLSLLVELGEVRKLATAYGPDRYDARMEPHYHFLCARCGSILDLDVAGLDHINILAGQNFGGRIDGHVAYFYGICPECLQKEDECQENKKQ